MKNNIKITKCIVISLLIVLIAGIAWMAISSLTPPDSETMNKCFQRDKDDLMIIADYLGSSEHSFISIDKSDIENGVMFTGAKTRYEAIDDAILSASLNRMLSIGKYKLIGKNGNTVFFKKWQFLEKDRGIAVPVNKENPPVVEFLIRSEPLSEEGWYYYEADYEKFRNDKT